MAGELTRPLLREIREHIRITEMDFPNGWDTFLGSVGIPVFRVHWGDCDPGAGLRHYIDWDSVHPHFMTPPLKDDSVEASVTAGLLRSPLIHHAEILMDAGHDDPVVALPVEFFIQNWAKISMGLWGCCETMRLATPDGTLFMEFVLRGDYPVYSNFEILPGTLVMPPLPELRIPIEPSAPELTHPYLKLIREHLRITELGFPQGWDMFLLSAGIPVNQEPARVGSRTHIDWAAVPQRHEISLVDPAVSSLVTAGLMRSALAGHAEVLMECGYSDPVVALQVEYFIQNWEELVDKISGQKASLATPDGGLFMEFTDDARYLLISNFVILPDTSVASP